MVVLGRRVLSLLLACLLAVAWIAFSRRVFSLCLYLVRAVAAKSIRGRVLSLLLGYRRSVALCLLGHRVYFPVHALPWSLVFDLRGHGGQASFLFP